MPSIELVICEIMSRYAHRLPSLYGKTFLNQNTLRNQNTVLNSKSKESICNQNRAMSIRAKKRFYKDVSLVDAGKNSFELLLDSKKLKTPLGAVFSVPSEPLALAVAHEWESQKDLVILSQMHLTGLCNTAVDNCMQATKYGLVDDILNFLDTDTILFFSDNQEKLYKRQIAEWQPIIDWFSKRHQISISPSTSIFVSPKELTAAKEVVRRHLLSYNMEAVHGFTFGIDAIKSILLMCAIVDKILTVEEAVKLSRLEVDYQIDHWGNVEWAHTLDLNDTLSRVAAAELFIQCNTSQYLTKEKNALL